ncbi:MAG: hypothetical protein B6U87_02725 [Candidatus Aenigmarchaeota archaeon ex4484_52]|nr:MAG: hypothetical protein B6U87_02725 [Candidatus Aenigmarchaeota archaeon ex4484_52]
MKKTTEKFIFIFFVILIFSSGCTKQTSSTSGVIIEDAHISPQKAFAEEDLVIYTTLKNTGSVNADNIEITLKKDGFNIVGEETQSKDLLEAEVENQVKNNEAYVEWGAISYENKKPFDIEYNPSIELCYHYKTRAIIKIKSMPIEEYRLMQDRGIVPEKYLEIRQTKGPIQMDISTNSLLIKKQGEEDKITMNIDLVNTGLKKGGFVYSDSTTIDFLKGKASVRYPFK